MDAHFAVSFQIQHLHRTFARRMAGSGQQWQEGVGVALTNILIMATRRGRLPECEAVLALGRLRRLPIETVDMTLSDDAGVIRLADKHRLTAYDATYLFLATRRGAPLATADRALARAAKEEGVQFLLKETDG